MAVRLILVEGIPGSGKSTTARLIAEWLQRRGKEVAFYAEGNLDHPADFESVACLDEIQYQALKELFPDWQNWLAAHALIQNQDIFFSYRKLEKESGAILPEALFQALAKYEIYELPVHKHVRLMQENWRYFTAQAGSQPYITVFECCFFQNPITFFLGRNTEPVNAVRRHILELAQIITPLDPILFYLKPTGTRQVLEDVAQTRPVDWLESVISYHTTQGSGKARGWQGFDGLVDFYEMRQQVELDTLPLLPWQFHLIEHQGWEQDHRLVLQLLEQAIEPE